jgi:hypothetical protein
VDTGDDTGTTVIVDTTDTGDDTHTVIDTGDNTGTVTPIDTNETGGGIVIIDDTGPIDTSDTSFVDTFVPADTMAPLDTIDTSVPMATADTAPTVPCVSPGFAPVTTLPELRSGAGGFVAGTDQVHVCGLVVTAMSNLGFVLQDPNASEYGGIFVFSAGNFPQGLMEGAVVDITGDYLEFDNNGSETDVANTLAQLTVLGGSSEIFVTGATAALPTPIPVTLADLADPTTRERYESMRVVLSEASEPLVVTQDTTGNFGEFYVSSASFAGEQNIDNEFVDQPLTVLYPALTPGDTFDSVTGVLHFSWDLHKVAPNTSTDLVGYTMAP